MLNPLSAPFHAWKDANSSSLKLQTNKTQNLPSFGEDGHRRHTRSLEGMAFVFSAVLHGVLGRPVVFIPQRSRASGSKSQFKTLKASLILSSTVCISVCGRHGKQIIHRPRQFETEHFMVLQMSESGRVGWVLWRLGETMPLPCPHVRSCPHTLTQVTYEPYFCGYSLWPLWYHLPTVRDPVSTLNPGVTHVTSKPKTAAVCM